MNNDHFLAIQVKKDDIAFIDRCQAEAFLGQSVLKTSSFDGATAVVTIVIPIVGTVMPFVVSILKEQIRARRYVKVVYKGAQIQGIDEKNVEKILRALAENDKK